MAASLVKAGDTAGINFWTAELDRGVPRGTMLSQFSESAEYKATGASSVYVTAMYLAFLRRAPDQGGFDFWKGEIGRGVPGQNLVNQFLGSGEYRLRFLVG